LSENSNRKEKMKKSQEVDRLEKMHKSYAKMNVSEILDRIENIASDITFDPAPEDIDILLGNAEEVLELVATLRAHFGIPVPDYEHESNLRK
jgi:hypothetical protein